MIYDELGHPWRVTGGDPAARLVGALRRRRYELIVLPCLTLATGQLTEPAAEPDDVIRRTRLLDCLDVLRKERT